MLRVFENRALRRKCGPKTDEVMGEWRKLHIEELNDLYFSPDIFRVIKSRIMIWAEHVTGMERVEVYTEFWWGNMREKDHLEDTGICGRIIFLVLQGVGCGGMGWIDLAQDRDRWRALVNTLTNLRVPHNAGNFLTS